MTANRQSALDLDALIAQLQEIRSHHGNMPVTTNGEHGCEEPIMLTNYQCSVGTAEAEHDGDALASLELEPETIILHIGGY